VSNSVPRVGQCDIAELDGRTVTGFFENAIQRLAEAQSVEVIEIEFSFSSITDEIRHPQERQMMANRRLRFMKKIAQSGHMQFAGSRQEQQDPQTRIVSQKPKDMAQLLNGSISDWQRG
jgi:hypothetical protein